MLLFGRSCYTWFKRLQLGVLLTSWSIFQPIRDQELNGDLAFACFPALGTGSMFSRTWHRLHVFPRMAPVAWFPELRTGYMVSRAGHRLYVFLLHVFPRLALVFFPRMAPVAWFPELRYRLHVFPRFSPVTCFCFEKHRPATLILSQKISGKSRRKTVLNLFFTEYSFHNRLQHEYTFPPFGYNYYETIMITAKSL